MMPRPVKKRRKVDEDGSMEECEPRLPSATVGYMALNVHPPGTDWDLLFEDDEQQNHGDGEA